jgi:biotin carboxylase
VSNWAPAPCLLVLGGSTDQLFMLKTARDMGLRSACLDGNARAPGLGAADLAAALDFSDLPAVFAWVDAQRAAGEMLQGVATMGSDVPHLVAAIAARYGWCGPSPETGRLATDKLAMKERFAELGVGVPRFGAVHDGGDVRKLWREWNCRQVVIKPTDRAGSRGVRVLSRDDQIDDAVDHARGQGRSGDLLLEEYVPGPQISTETILWRGRAVTPGFVDRMYDGMACFQPQIMENGGWLPSLLDDTPARREVEALVEAAAHALGIESGVGKGDVVVCPRRGPLMIEMAARLSGGDFSAGLVPLGTGVNYVRAVIDIALGREPDWALFEATRHTTVANRYFFPPAGRLEAVEVPPDFRAHPGVVKLELAYGPGDIIPPITSHGQRGGVMVLTGPDRATVQSLVDEGYARVRFRIDGQWRTGEPGGAAR